MWCNLLLCTLNGCCLLLCSVTFKICMFRVTRTKSDRFCYFSAYHVACLCVFVYMRTFPLVYSVYMHTLSLFFCFFCFFAVLL